MPTQSASRLSSESLGKRYVRFHELDERGFVHFDFAIDDPELSVELTLPLASFRQFCEENDVVQLTVNQMQQLDHDASKWRFGHSGIWE